MIFALMCIVTGGADYTPVNETLTFSSATQTICINIMINDDTVVENDSIFDVVLSTNDDSITVKNNLSQVIVKDDDSE